ARVRLFEYWVLIVEHERRSSPCVGAWKFRVLDDDPRVGVELAVHVAAYHLTKLGPGRESHARCMTDDQPLAVVVHEGQKIFLLLIRQHTVAGGQHEYRVVVIQRASVDAAALITSSSGNLSFGDELRIRCDD